MSVKKDVGDPRDDLLLRGEGVGLQKLSLWYLQLRTRSLNSGQLKWSIYIFNCQYNVITRVYEGMGLPGGKKGKMR